MSIAYGHISFIKIKSEVYTLSPKKKIESFTYELKITKILEIEQNIFFGYNSYNNLKF